MQHPPHQNAAGQLQGPVECGQPGCRPARVRERQPEGGQHVSLALGGTGLAGQPKRGPQFTDPRADITSIPQNNSGGLMGYGCLIRARPLRENCACPG